MTAVELVRLLAQGAYVLVFVATLVEVVRRPTRARADIALFFGAAGFAIIEGRLEEILGPFPAVLSELSIIAVMAMAYLLLRLLDDFAGVPFGVKRLAEAGLALSAVLIVAFPPPFPTPAVLVLMAYFVSIAGYASIGFVQSARSTPGVTRRRMEAVALGSALLACAILVAGLSLALPVLPTDFSGGITQALTLASALAYYAGFVTPQWLRRYWREPELRAFLERAAQLPRMPDTASIVAEIERHVGDSLGARTAVGLWDDASGVLRFAHLHESLPDEIGPGPYPTWRTFEAQRAGYFPDAARVNPGAAEAYLQAGIRTMLVAPITAGERRVGVLAAYATREPIFAEDDLDYVQLLADQAAVVLESRALIDEAARVHAEAEAARMKEDFISAAAHDLKTPLTTLLGQAQLLERRYRGDPSRQAELPAVERIGRVAGQLADLVQDLLEAGRLDQGDLDLHREPVDLAGLARDVATRQPGAEGRVAVESNGPTVAEADPQRMRQVLRNLLENALKYSDPGSPVRVRVWQEDATARVAVEDRGMGIPRDELGPLFERFRRGSNVDERRASGIGLGLYICRGIIQRHGGRVWAESTVGEGSTFHVALPLLSEPDTSSRGGKGEAQDR